MAAKVLVFVLLLFAISIDAQRINPKKPDPVSVTPNSESSDELRRHLSAAETYQISGDLINAAVENRAIVGIALQRVGNILIEEGEYASAAAILTESIPYADSSENRTNLAVAYQRLNQTGNAIAAARAAIELDPKFAGAHYLLGNIYFQNEDYESARPELEKVLLLAPDFDAALALGITYLHLKQPDRAKLLFEELQISLGKDTPDIHVSFGQAYEQTNYPLEAEREFKRALAIDPRHPRANFFLGYVILQHGGSDRIAEAGAAFENELKLTPTDFYSNFFAGVVASSVNKHQEAIVYFEKSSKARPTRPESFLFLGASQSELNDLAAAERNLRKAISLAGNETGTNFESRRTHFLLGRLLVRTGRKEEGEKELKIASELQAKSIQTARDEISQILGQVVGATKSNSGKNDPGNPEKDTLKPERAAELKKFRLFLNDVLAQAFHNLGVIAVQNGQTDTALDNFAAASKWRPDFPGLDRNWGIVGFRAGKFEAAIGPLSRHLKANPGDDLARQMLGSSYYLTQDFAKAAEVLKALEPVIAANPELAYFYGISLTQLKRNQEAAPVFAKLSEISQDKSEALFYAAQGFMMLGDFERAVKDFKRVVSLDPSVARANYFIGQSLIRLNRFEEAEKAFSRELELNPGDVLSKYHLALTFIERKTAMERAVLLLEEAIGLKYDYADARYQLGKILLERGETPKAIEQLEFAAIADATKEYIYYQLSIAYRKAARKEDADRALKRYQELKAAARKTDSPMGNNENSPE